MIHIERRRLKKIKIIKKLEFMKFDGFRQGRVSVTPIDPSLTPPRPHFVQRLQLM
jgi:hypothetical protein